MEVICRMLRTGAAWRDLRWGLLKMIVLKYLRT